MDGGMQPTANADAGAQPEATGLALLRRPFPPNQISKLPKPTKKQTDEVRDDFKKGIRCQICGAWHHKDVVHLDYVGHAALTDRLLDADPEWNWAPVATTDKGVPALDENGGMWIRLTVCGVTRLGYGDADGKTGGNAVKEAIGDAIRNAGMRFGMALDLWHKGDLHLDDDASDAPANEMPDAEWSRLIQLVEASAADTGKMINHFGVKNLRELNQDQYAEAIDMLNTKLAKKVKTKTQSLAEELADEISF